MPSPYMQLLLVNMLLAALISTTVLGAPILPAVAGALAAGALLCVRSKAKSGHKTSQAGTAEAAAFRGGAPSAGQCGIESAPTAPAPAPASALPDAGTGV
jgi:hypothetical protein